MRSLLRPTARALATALVPVTLACSSSTDFQTREGATGSGGSAGADAGTSGTGNNGGSGKGNAGGNSGAGGRVNATGGTGGTNVGGTAGTGGSNVGGTAGSGTGGNQGTRDAGACAFSTAPSPPPDLDPSAPVEARANSDGLHMLDYFIGRFLRGEVGVYSGTAQARDNRSALVNSVVYGPRPDSVMPAGQALAYLQVRPAIDRDWDPTNPNPTGTTSTLVVHGLPPDQHVIFRQHSIEPSRTEVGLLSGIATTVQMATSCNGCVPDLSGRPAKIAFTNLAATGQMTVYMGYAYDGGHNVDVTAKVTASADLTVVPPCSLTFEDLAIIETATGPNEIDLTMSSFKQVGNEMVYSTGGSVNVGGTAMCPLVQSYTIDYYVDLDDLGHYGTRNFVAGTPSVRCVPGTP